MLNHDAGAGYPGKVPHICRSKLMWKSFADVESFADVGFPQTLG
jgi:hypothetical protein